MLGGLLFAAGTTLLGNGMVGQSDRIAALDSFTDQGKIDWTKVRKQFLLSSKKHHFNTGSLGPSPSAVVDKVCDLMRDLEERAYIGHEFTIPAHKKLAAFLNTTEEEIAITRNATEGMNIVARSLPLKAGDEILLTNHEHIGGAAPWMALQKDKGVIVKLVTLDMDGENNLQIIQNNITEKTRVISVSHVTFTTGMRLPVKEIATLCREKGIYSCIDGAQAVGMIPVDLKAINPDFYVGSGHKWMFGPKGTGLLFINKATIGACSPVFAGAYSDQEFDLNNLTLVYRNTVQREEYGTRNTPIIAGFGRAVDYISAIGIENIENRGQELANHFLAGLEKIPGIILLTPKNPAFAASIVTINKKGMDARKTALKLYKEKRIKVRAIFENDLGGLRISFSIFNSIKEVDLLLDALKETLTD
ncbi:MAG: aminotransferase class V-fold PLP-dependent enzyme [Bacteroidia bacterium]